MGSIASTRAAERAVLRTALRAVLRTVLRGPLRAGVLAIGLVAASSAVAQEAKALTKAEVETFVVGRKLQYVRVADGSKVAFDVRDNGRLYYDAARSQRNLQVPGSYTIADDGLFCFKWETDKYVTLQDGCLVFRRDGAKTQVYTRRNPAVAMGDVIE